jgi:hypothetical protein
LDNYSGGIVALTLQCPRPGQLLMEQHVKILGILYIIIGGLGVAAALIVFGVFGGIAGVARAGEHTEAVPLFVLLGSLAMIVILAISAPSIIAGVGLLYFKPWARIVTIILSVIHLFSVPFGTALGVYGLWVLLQRETEPLFRRAIPG